MFRLIGSASHPSKYSDRHDGVLEFEPATGGLFSCHAASISFPISSAVNGLGW